MDRRRDRVREDGDEWRRGTEVASGCEVSKVEAECGGAKERRKGKKGGIEKL